MQSRSFRNGSAVALLLVWSAVPATAGLVAYTSETSFLSHLSPTQLVNFDSDPVGTPIADAAVINLQYQSLGLEFSSFNGGGLNAMADSNPDNLGRFPAVSSPNQMRTVPNAQGGGGFQLQLDQPASAVGMFFGDVEFPGSTIEALDSNGQSLGTIDIQARIGHSPSQWKFLGVRSTDAAIAQLQVSFAGNDYITVDNLRTGDTIPEPASVALLFAAVCSLVIQRQYRTTDNGRLDQKHNRAISISP
jgi:hypothetical protein